MLQNHFGPFSKRETENNCFHPVFREHRKTLSANQLTMNLIKELILKI